MTQKEYDLVCLLIDRNSKAEDTYYGQTHKLYKDDITQLKKDLRVLIDQSDVTLESN